MLVTCFKSRGVIRVPVWRVESHSLYRLASSLCPAIPRVVWCRVDGVLVARPVKAVPFALCWFQARGAGWLGGGFSAGHRRERTAKTIKPPNRLSDKLLCPSLWDRAQPPQHTGITRCIHVSYSRHLLVLVKPPRQAVSERTMMTSYASRFQHDKV